MSCCGDQDEEAAKSKEIDKFLAQMKKALEKKIKLLLLGAGECGKTTVCKQMKLLHLAGYNEEERRHFVPIIIENIVSAIDCILKAAQQLELSFQPENQELVCKYSETTPKQLTPEITAHFKRLWEDPIIPELLQKQDKFTVTLNDSCHYFMSALDRISGPGYLPTDQDILRARVKTCTISELAFQYRGVAFSLTDVGGQRSERRKWLHCFQGVTAILFCASLAEYNQTLREDATTNRMTESLRLFKEIASSTWFEGTPIILFLNKTDLLQEKIATIPLTVCFPEYIGPQTYSAAAEFIKSKFVRLRKTDLYSHFTCATDTQNIERVFAAAAEIILSSNIDSNGFVM